MGVGGGVSVGGGGVVGTAVGVGLEDQQAATATVTATIMAMRSDRDFAIRDFVIVDHRLRTGRGSRAVVEVEIVLHSSGRDRASPWRPLCPGRNPTATRRRRLIARGMAQRPASCRTRQIDPALFSSEHGH